jgi:hypothetical protein
MTVSLEDFWNELPKVVSISNRAVVAEFLDDHRSIWPGVEAETDPDRQHLLRRAEAIAGRLTTVDPNAQQNELVQKQIAAGYAQEIDARTGRFIKDLQGVSEDDRTLMLNNALAAVGSTLRVS